MEDEDGTRIMQLSANQTLSDKDKMIAYICRRIPQPGCRVVLARGEDGTAWADLTPLWDDELGWDLRFETNLPEWVTLAQIYEHFREEDMTSWEREESVGASRAASAAENGEPSVLKERLEHKIDQILQELRRIVGETAEMDGAAVEPLENATTLTKAEVARHFKISERTVDRLRAAGHDLGEMRIGAVIRFDAAKIQQIIAAKKLKRRRQSPSPLR